MSSHLLALLSGRSGLHPVRLIPFACAAILIGSLAGSVPGVAADSMVAHAEDQLFSVRTLSQARLAAGDERLVVVYLTEDNNDDCAFMEAEAWTHPDVRAWVDEYAVAARIDARSFHGASLKGRYGVDNVPAVLAFRGENLARRHEGPLDGNKLLAWLEVVRVGDVAAADMLLAEEPETGGEPPAVDIDRALMDAFNAPNPMAATNKLLEAWRKAIGTPQQEPRRPRLAEALRPYLINQESRELVQRERDAAWSRHRRNKRLGDLADWVALNHLLEEDSVTVEWAREAREDRKKGIVTLRELVKHPQDPLLGVLAKRGDWQLIGAAIGDPIELVDLRLQVHKQTRITITGAESDADRALLREQFAAIVVGLLADGRDKEARDTSDHVMELDRGAGPTIVTVALRAEQPRRWMRGLLNPHKAEQVQLAMELTQALEAR